MQKDKRERFVALAEKRVTRAIREIRLVGNLSNTRNYTYTEQEAQRITAALEQEMKALKSQFAAGLRKQEPLFKL